MEDKKAFYIASAVFSALTIISTDQVSAKAYDPVKKRCYGAALAGQNDCPSDVHSCKGTSTTDCNPQDWKLAMSQEECDKMIKECKKKMKK